MKSLLLSTLILLLILCSYSPVYSSWTEYRDIRYIDLDGDFINEIIIESEHGTGSNHYLEDLRIFKDTYPELKLIFHTHALDRTFGFVGDMKQYNCDIVSEIEFTEPNPENGTRNIVIKSKKIYYKDEQNKVVDREEDLGSKIYKWNPIEQRWELAGDDESLEWNAMEQEWEYVEPEEDEE